MEYVEVTVRIPKKLMDMLEAEDYFGYTQEEFFVATIKGQTGALWGSMPYKMEMKLRKKYGEEAITYTLPKSFNC